MVNNNNISKKIKLIQNLYINFQNLVISIAKTIILEKYLPNYEKTIKFNNIGGKAGGEKYIVSFILKFFDFKFIKIII